MTEQPFDYFIPAEAANQQIKNLTVRRHNDRETVVEIELQTLSLWLYKTEGSVQTVIIPKTESEE